MEKSKKIISLLLALIMTLSVFTIVPFSVGAAEADVSPVGAPESYTDIHIGDTLFPEFEDGVDTAYFKFIPEQDMPIIFTSRLSFGVTAYLYDAEMNQLAFSNESSHDLDRAGGFNFKIAYDVTAGNTYYFGVKDKSSSFFDVQLRELPEIRVGETAAAMFANGGDYAYFKFVPEQDMTIDFTALTNDEAYGYLYDADMNLLTYHENKRGSFDIVYDVTAGNTYYLCAYYSYGGSMNVQLKIKKDPEIKPTEPPTQSPTDVPAQVINSGTTGDCTWTLDDEGVLTISGNGAMAGYNWNSTAPWGENITEVIIQDGVTNIGKYAFEYCKELTSVTIPDSVTSIGDSAFSGCSGLTSITIPNSVTSIGDEAFRNCDNLTSVAIPDSVTSIGDEAFWNCSGLTSVMIGNSVTSIGSEAFYLCTGLTSVTIGNSVTSIGDWAFWNCSGLTGVTIPDSVTSIGEKAFAGCSGLTNVTIPDSVTSIDWGTFSGCSGLTSVTIPDSVTSIGSEAFSGCTGLTSVTISNSVTSIGNETFKDCTGLTSVTIPDSVTWIGDDAFYGCTGLTSIVVDADNPVYDSRNNCNAIIETESNTLLSGCRNTVIPDSVTSIDDHAFDGCTGLTSVTIGNLVTSIGYGAFEGCTGLTSVTIPDSVTRIDGWAFKGCTGLTSVTIGNSVESIGDDAFYGCTGLTSITIPNSVTSIDWGTFSGCSGLTSVTIPDSVTSIGEYAFSGCTGLTSVTIPDSVTSIGYEAFYKCTGLTSITIGNSVTSIGDSAFSGCCGLTSVTIPDSVTSIGSEAFYKCTGLTSITIGNSVESIGDDAFRNCDNLTSVTIPESVIEIGNRAFGYYFDDKAWTLKQIDGFTIYGYEGSSAEAYAKENGFSFIDLNKLVELHDDTTDISVTLTDDVELSVADVTGSETTGNIQLVGEKIEKAYEIKLMNDGEAIQPSGEVTVKIPCNNENAKVYRVEADGSLTDMHAVYTDGYLVFTTDHFSVYIVAVDEPEANALLGDVDGDGSVTIIDATFIQRHLASIPIPFEFNSTIADTDEDGSVSIIDATYIQRWLASLKSNDKIGKPLNK